MNFVKKMSLSLLLGLGTCKENALPSYSSNNGRVRIEPTQALEEYSLHDVSEREANRIQSALPCHPNWTFYPDGTLAETYHLEIPPGRRESSDWATIQKALREEGLEAYRCSVIDHSTRF